MTVLYLIDANTLIRADADFYPIDRIPGFWKWLVFVADIGLVKMPAEIYGEVDRSKDQLGLWMRQPDVREALLLKEPTNGQLVQRVLDDGYGRNLNQVELDTIGNDPFLIAAALRSPDRIVVTREVSKPKMQRQNRKIPDVCRDFGVEPITDYELYRRLKFSLDGGF